MSTDSRHPNALSPAPRQVLAAPRRLCAVLMMGGLAGLLLGPTAIDADPTPSVLLANFIFWSGLAFGVVVWAAILWVARASWAGAVSRIGHAGIAFLPVSLAALGLVYFLGDNTLPWLRHPVPGKEAWLNPTFFWAREAGGILLLTILSAVFVAAALRADSRVEAPKGARRGLTVLAISVVLAYPVTFSLIALDFVMALSPRWSSTVFPPYFFVTNLYASLAALILLAFLLRRTPEAGPHLGIAQFRDLANLMLSFGMLSIGLFYAQYLTIWYGNLPEEASWIIARYVEHPWRQVGWAAFAIGYGAPFVLLQSRWLKGRPGLLAVVAGIALVGVWLERCVMVVPSLAPSDQWFGITQALSSIGFAGAFGYATLVFLGRVAPISKAGLDIELSDGASL